jgi:hypothetical protein
MSLRIAVAITTHNRRQELERTLGRSHGCPRHQKESMSVPTAVGTTPWSSFRKLIRAFM